MLALDMPLTKRRSRPASGRDDLAWWREARFGLFIHWGLYAIPAGFWKGRPLPYLGEWIMYHGKIPFADYAPLAERFHPRHWDPAAIVRLAKQAGICDAGEEGHVDVASRKRVPGLLRQEEVRGAPFDI